MSVAARLLACFALGVVAGAARTQSLPTKPTLGAGAESGSGALERTAWRRVDTAHFVLLGDVPPTTLRELAIDLEALESLLATLNPGDSTPAPPRAEVLVFADQDAFAQHAPLTAAGAPAAVSGFFLSHPHGDFVVVDGAEPDVRRTLYHEALHRFVRHHLPEAPLWLNEGLAEFYSTLDVASGEAWVGRPVVEHVVRLQREPRRPVSELLAIDAESHVYGEADPKGAFYAEAWALVHYLLTDEESGRAAIASYAGRLRSGEDPIAAFADVFGEDAGLDRRVEQHLRRAPREPLRASLAALGRADRLTVSIVTGPELDYRLGWLLSHHSPPREAAARARFESALRVEPDHAGALAGIGWLEELQGDLDAARQHYARAAELDPRDPLAPPRSSSRRRPSPRRSGARARRRRSTGRRATASGGASSSSPGWPKPGPAWARPGSPTVPTRARASTRCARRIAGCRRATTCSST
jgi:hypothetical protein